MSADLHIHSTRIENEPDNPLNLDDLRCFFSPFMLACGVGLFEFGTACPHLRRVIKSDQVWIGEVSWLKAALMEDSEAYVPYPVARVHRSVMDTSKGVNSQGLRLAVLDQALRSRILEALELPNQTTYQVADPKDVDEWLAAHMGDQIFTVSW